MASQTFTIGAESSSGAVRLSWDASVLRGQGYLIDPELVAGGTAAYLAFMEIRSTLAIENSFRTTHDDSEGTTIAGPELTDAWEISSSAFVLSAGGLSLTLKGPNHSDVTSQDDSEPYEWFPDNLAEIGTFLTAYSALTQDQKDATTLTLDDGIERTGSAAVSTGAPSVSATASRSTEERTASASVSTGAPSVAASASRSSAQSRTASSAISTGAPTADTTVSFRGIPLTLSDWDGTGLDEDVLALIESGPRDSVFGQSPRPVSGSLLDGELGMTDDDVAITRITIFSSGANVRLNDNDVDLHLGLYFTGDGNDLTIYFQTAEELMSFTVDGNIATNGGNFVNFSVPSGMRTFLNGITQGDRFIFALARATAASERTGSSSVETGAPTAAATGSRTDAQNRTASADAETGAPTVTTQASRTTLGTRSASTEVETGAPNADTSASRSTEERTASASAETGAPTTTTSATRTGLGERPADSEVETGATTTTAQGSRSDPQERTATAASETGSPTVSATGGRVGLGARASTAAVSTGATSSEAQGSRSDSQERTGTVAADTEAPAVSATATRTGIGGRNASSEVDTGSPTATGTGARTDPQSRSSTVTVELSPLIFSATSERTPPATVPDAPSNLVETGQTQSIILIDWIEPSDNGASIIRYEVRIDSSAWTSTGMATTGYRLTGLTPGTAYSITVRAVNSVGDGPASLPLTVQIIVASPPSVPIFPAIQTTGQTSLGIFWTTPESDGGSPILRYEVSVIDEFGNSSPFEATEGPANRHRVRGLSIGHRYSLQLRAVNAAGSSPKTTRIYGTPIRTATVSVPTGQRLPLINADRQSLIVRIADQDVRIHIWWQPSDSGWWASLEVPVNTPAVSSRRLGLNSGILDRITDILPGNLVLRELGSEGLEPGRDAWSRPTHGVFWEPR